MQVTIEPSKPLLPPFNIYDPLISGTIKLYSFTDEPETTKPKTVEDMKFQAQ